MDACPACGGPVKTAYVLEFSMIWHECRRCHWWREDEWLEPFADEDAEAPA